MSEENVELIRRSYAAFNRGDIDDIVANVGSGLRVCPPAGVIPGVMGVYRGPEGFKQWSGAFWGEFDDARIEVHEFVDAGDQVLATLTVRGRGKQSGAESRWTLWELWTVRDGKLVHGQAITSRDEALEAAGLPE
jgi:ketosteroid isomerase-like protein